MVVATSRKRVATASAITEGLVNLVASILLASHLGARGVALGTLAGSFASVGMHFGVSMHFTRKNFAISRLHLLFDGILRPAVTAIPSILLVPYWWISGAPTMNRTVWFLWATTTLLFAWFLAMNGDDRKILAKILNKRSSFFGTPNN